MVPWVSLRPALPGTSLLLESWRTRTRTSLSQWEASPSVRLEDHNSLSFSFSFLKRIISVCVVVGHILACLLQTIMYVVCRGHPTGSLQEAKPGHNCFTTLLSSVPAYEVDCSLVCSGYKVIDSSCNAQPICGIYKFVRCHSSIQPSSMLCFLSISVCMLMIPSLFYVSLESKSKNVSECVCLVLVYLIELHL